MSLGSMNSPLLMTSTLLLILFLWTELQVSIAGAALSSTSSSLELQGLHPSTLPNTTSSAPIPSLSADPGTADSVSTSRIPPIPRTTSLVSTTSLLSPVPPPKPVTPPALVLASGGSNGTVSPAIGDGSMFRPVILHANGTQSSPIDYPSLSGGGGPNGRDEGKGTPAFRYSRTFIVPPGHFGLRGHPEWHLFVEEPTLLYSDPTLSVTHSPRSSMPTPISPHSFRLIKVEEATRLPYDTYFLGHDRRNGGVLCLAQGWLWTGLRFQPCSSSRSLRLRGIERNEATGVTRISFLDSSGVLGTERCLKIRSLLGPKAHLESCQDGDAKEAIMLADPSTGEIIDPYKYNVTMSDTIVPY